MYVAERHIQTHKSVEKAGLVTRRTIGRTHWIEPKVARSSVGLAEKVI